VSRHLFIVSRQQPGVYAYLAREFSREPEVQVILDRRQGERRQPPGGPVGSSERRHSDRRNNEETGSQLSGLGYAFVRLA